MLKMCRSSGDMLGRNVLGKQFKGFIIQSFSFSQWAAMSLWALGENRRSGGEVRAKNVMTRSLYKTATVSPLSSGAYLTWNVQGQAVRQAAQALSSLVYRSSRAHRLR